MDKTIFSNFTPMLEDLNKSSNKDIDDLNSERMKLKL